MKNINFIFLFGVFVITLFVLGCENKSELSAPEIDYGNADFSSFVSIGNSLTAGYQSSALYKSSQDYSIGSLIAKQVGGVTYQQPLISDPGIGGRLEVSSIEPFTMVPNSSIGSPINSDYSRAYNNLGIPGIVLPDVLTTTSSPSEYVGDNPFIDIVLRGNGTVLEQALGLQPTFVVSWIGNNDILGYATSGGMLPHTPVETFAYLYGQYEGALAQSGAKVLVATIPDVSAIPFFTTVGPGVGLVLKDLQAANPSILGLFYQTTSSPFYGLATPDGLLAGSTLLTLTGSGATDFLGDVSGAYYSSTGSEVPPGVDTNQPFGLHPLNPFPNQFVLDPNEKNEVEITTRSFNAKITRNALSYGFAVADIYAFFNNIAKNGYHVDGIDFSTQFFTGGIFSLDGVHTTSRGYAIVSNYFISRINVTFNAQIPHINISTIPGSINVTGGAQFNKYGIPILPAKLFDNLYF